MNHEFHDKHDINILSYEYIRGLVEGEGCFTFCPGYRKAIGKYKIPTFTIALHERDFSLLQKLKYTLGLKNKIYIHQPKSNDGYNRGPKAILMVRDFQQLKDIIIPLFYKKLNGYKNQQFMEWLERIGQNPDVSNRYKALYRIYKFGIYDQPKFMEKYKN